MKKITLTISKDDLTFINHLKNKNNVSEDELRAMGTIFLMGLRGGLNGLDKLGEEMIHDP